jgi:uncharacterized protein YjbI with pentapeptide repeats
MLDADMNLEDFTPFTPVALVTAKDGVGYVATVLVKATFGMQLGSFAQPLEDQLFPIGDTYAEGATAASSLAYASDLVPYKVNADVLLSATAYRPADKPKGSFRVGIRVGQLSKQLVVFGHRKFKQGVVSSSIEDGEPLATVAMLYENAFGGPGYPQNPLGRGHKSDELPLIEYPDRLVQRPGDKPTPAGFGPIAADWEPRKSMVGTFGPDYREKYWPGFPPNFDARYFNAAPTDQQVEGFLRGDEEIVLENLHPTHPIYSTRLPGWRVVCTREDEDGRCECVPLVIDTLWIRPDTNELVLIWRGRMFVQTPDSLEVKRLGFLVEGLAAPLRDASYYRDRVQALIDERDAEFQPESPPTEGPQGSDELESVSAEPDEEDRTLESQLAAIRAAAGQPAAEAVAATELPPLTPEAQAELEKIMAQLEAEELRDADEEQVEGEDEPTRWTRQEVIAAVKASRSFEDADLSNLDLSECEFVQADFRGAKLDGVNFSRSDLTRAILTSCSLDRSRFDAATLKEANLNGASLQESSLIQAHLTSSTLSGADLTCAVIDGANLSSVVAENAIFEGASLVAANCSNANLSGAVLSNAKCSKCIFSGALLTGATLDHADFTAADFRRAIVSDAVFTASKLNSAVFDAARLGDADFTEAELVNASFVEAHCDGVWLSSAKADGANFARASCIDLQLDGTSAKQANFSGCCITWFRGSQRANLSGAIFHRAHGIEPIFQSCLIDEADFSQADIPGANFMHASAARANFTAADLKEARFDHANLESAQFLSANLFQAVFAGVNLNGADISEGNFYGAEFLDARISKLRLKNSNLQMTKLEQWAATKNQ